MEPIELKSVNRLLTVDYPNQTVVKNIWLTSHEAEVLSKLSHKSIPRTAIIYQGLKDIIDADLDVLFISSPQRTSDGVRVTLRVPAATEKLFDDIRVKYGAQPREAIAYLVRCIDKMENK